MTASVHGARLVMMVVLVLTVPANATAQLNAPRQVTASAGHSVWRDTLIGLGVGVSGGLMIGKMRENFHNTECRVLECNRVFEMDTLGPIGAVTGAAIGFVVHRLRHGGEPRSSLDVTASTQRHGSRAPSVILAPMYTRARKAILLRAEF